VKPEAGAGTTTMTTIRWGMIGCGDVAEMKSGPGFQKAAGSALVAVMRRHGDLAADFARRHGVAAWYDDADALIADPAVDAVYIATPPGAHEQLALAVCAAGKPAYVEKPMARNHAECQRMVDAFAAARVPLFVAYYRRALPRFRQARDLVAAGRLGRITGVTYRMAGPFHRDFEARLAAQAQTGAPLPWRLQAEHAGGGLFLDVGCHTLDILDFIVGPLQQVRGVAANVATPHFVEDAVAISFRTGGGVPGTAHWSFASAEKADEIIVAGDRGELRLSTFGNEPVERRDGDGVERFDLPNPAHIQQPMIQSIVDELRGKGRCDSTGVSAARTSAIIDAALVDYYGTRADGFWRSPESWPGQQSARWRESALPRLGSGG
jgi:1,5-anhydro-D-fructose reductase (1,5-anhydro-D-mannitol-forming)